MKPLHTIAPGCRVVLHFSLTLPDGTEAVSTFDEQALEFSLGDGTMAESLEEALIGLSPGAEEIIILSGDEVFGAASEEMVQRIPRQTFPTDMNLEPGHLISFSTPGGDELAGAVLEVDEETALVDFNHPLSGMAIAFHVKILEVFPEHANHKPH